MPQGPGRELSDAVVAEVTARMQEQGLTQTALARSTGMLQGTISDHLAGKGCLSPDRVRAYAEALGTDLHELLGAAQKRL